jgi:hypothetical protein
VFWSEDPLSGSKDLPVLRLGRYMVAAGGNSPCDAVPGSQGVGVLGAEDLEPGSKNAAESFLCLRLLTALGQFKGDPIPGSQGVEMIRAEDPLLDG